MDILIIGGTIFLGRALVEAAVAQGHKVTLFNRGRSNPAAFPEIETIIGDRETDLDLLRGRRWDAVIDTCGYLPRLVDISAEALKGAVGHYSFISTLSVYPLQGASKRDEEAELLPYDDGMPEEASNASYGPLKIGCERAVQRAYPESALIIRAGLIAGPHDPTNRFTYWVTRTANGGDAIAPPVEQPLQFVDVRDVAEFTLRQTESMTNEIYNVTGPARRLAFGEFLAEAKDALDSNVRFRHVSDAFLQEQQVGEFMELPLWVNQELAESFMTFDCAKALRAGLRFRHLKTTVIDTYEWSKSTPEDMTKPADLSPGKEQELLAASAG